MTVSVSRLNTPLHAESVQVDLVVAYELQVLEALSSDEEVQCDEACRAHHSALRRVLSSSLAGASRPLDHTRSEGQPVGSGAAEPALNATELAHAGEK